MFSWHHSSTRPGSAFFIVDPTGDVVATCDASATAKKLVDLLNLAWQQIAEVQKLNASDVVKFFSLNDD